MSSDDLGVGADDGAVPGPRFGEVRRTAFGDLWAGPSPEFVSTVGEWTGLAGKLPAAVDDAVDAFFGYLFEANQHLSGVRGAERSLLTHAFNDAQLLIQLVYNGDGRSAARTARSIFEHYVNYLTVIGDPEAAQRYVSGRHVTADRLGNLTSWWLGLLTGPQRAAEEARLAKLVSDAQEPLAAAKAKFDRPGRRFENNIFSDNLYRRVVGIGLADEYDAYRVLSGVVHGDAGGLLGLSRDQDGGLIHRIGPDLQLVPLAYLYGFRWLADLFVNVAARHPFPSVAHLSECAAFIGAQFPEVLTAAQRLDEQTWPAITPPTPVAVVAFYGSSRQDMRWYLYDGAHEAVTVADPDQGSLEAVDDLWSTLKDAVAAYHWPSRRSIPCVAAEPRVTVYPRPDAIPHPAPAVLPPTETWSLPPHRAPGAPGYCV